MPLHTVGRSTAICEIASAAARVPPPGDCAGISCCTEDDKMAVTDHVRSACMMRVGVIPIDGVHEGRIGEVLGEWQARRGGPGVTRDKQGKHQHK